MTATQPDLGAHFKPGNVCDMGDHAGCPHPEGATLYLGGTAWAHPSNAAHLRPINTITPYPGNPRRSDQNQITTSIHDLGFYGTLHTQTSTGHVLVGNHRLRGLLALDAVLAPATDLDVPDTIAAAVVARDNYTSDQATNDPTDMIALLTRLADEEALALSGYGDTEMALLMRQAEAEDAFTVGTDHMLDEFRDIAGTPEGSPIEYDPGYVAKVRVYFRDDAAIEEFKNRLGFKGSLATAPAHELGWTLGGWKSYSRIERRQQETETP